MTAIQQFWHCEQPYVDPYWAYVKALLQFEGNLNDASIGGVPWTMDNGAFVTSTSGDILTGTGSFNTKASKNAACYNPVPTRLALGTGPFCIEFVFRDDNLGTKNQYFMLLEAHGNGHTVRFYGSNSATMTVDCAGGGPSAPEVAYPLWVRNHAAITRNGNNWTFWLNGQPVKTWVNSTFNGLTGAGVWFGRGSSGETGRQCLYDELRITVGVPRYTEAFNPIFPFPTRGP